MVDFIVGLFLTILGVLWVITFFALFVLASGANGDPQAAAVDFVSIFLGFGFVAFGLLVLSARRR